MDWINELLWGNGIAHTILLLSFTIAVGIQLGKIKIFGISLGITFVLFAGIFLGEMGFHIDPNILHYFKEFGLILFVYSIGMQVGPGFFSAFKKGGLTLNLLATGIVLLGVITTIILHFITGLPMTTMVGILSGAVTNTPGLGAAQQTIFDYLGINDTQTALGYAVAYPLGVVGIILSMIFLKKIFKIDLKIEEEKIKHFELNDFKAAVAFSILIKNPAIFGKSVFELSKLMNLEFVVSRVMHRDTENFEMVSSSTVLNEGDKIFIIANELDKETILAFLGEEIDMERKEWLERDPLNVARRIVVTKPEMSGKHLGELKLRSNYGINVTRINRSGVDLVASPNLVLQLGDRVNVVGEERAIKKTEELLGNSIKRLNEPNLISIFIGIFFGMILGSIPFQIPGIPQAIKLGLAGGPLIVAILVSRFGYKYKLITYTTSSANLMLREIGITLFLACVGLSAGNGFVDTIINEGGWAWIGYGFLITTIPILIIGILARVRYKTNYFTLAGLIAGSTTDPPALAYASQSTGSDLPSVSYATVYPLTMFLRVLFAQLLVLFF